MKYTKVPKLPKNTYKYLQLQKSNKKYQKVIESTKKYQKIPKRTKKLQDSNLVQEFYGRYTHTVILVQHSYVTGS